MNIFAFICGGNLPIVKEPQYADLSYGNCKVISIQELEPIIPSHNHSPTYVEDDKQWLRKICQHNKCNCSILTKQENFLCNEYNSVGNSLMSAFIQAYNTHQDVVLTPDDIWITILLEFSKYVNDNAEKLRSQFVSHTGQETLSVTTWNDTEESEWDEFFELMLKAIERNTIEGTVPLLQSDFTTSGRIEKLMSTAVIMDSFKQYFSYLRYIPMCGIRNVLFMGIRDDWMKLITKLQALAKYDVDGKLIQYINELTPVLNEFLNTYDNKVDIKWWNKVMNERFESIGSGNTSYFSGWILKFSLKHCMSNEIESTELEGKHINIPIKIDNKITGIIKTVNFIGGFGSGLRIEKNAYRPSMSFAIIHEGKENNY